MADHAFPNINFQQTNDFYQKPLGKLPAFIIIYTVD